MRSTAEGGDSDVIGIAGPTIKDATTYFVGAGDGTPLPPWSPFLQLVTKSATLAPGWKSPKTSSGPATPVATSEGVYLPDKTAVSLLATATGAVKAAMLPTAAEGHFRTPFDIAVDADRVYLGYLNGTTNVRTVTAFNRYTGARVWSKPIAIRPLLRWPTASCTSPRVGPGWPPTTRRPGPACRAGPASPTAPPPWWPTAVSTWGGVPARTTRRRPPW